MVLTVLVEVKAYPDQSPLEVRHNNDNCACM